MLRELAQSGKWGAPMQFRLFEVVRVNFMVIGVRLNYAV